MTPQPNEPTAEAIDAALKTVFDSCVNDTACDLVQNHIAALRAQNKSTAQHLKKEADGNRVLFAECEKLRAENEAVKQQASYLAEVIFKKHYARNQDYADGTMKWGLCDTTAGIISQIDNMFAGVAEQLAQSLTESEQLKVDLNKSRDNLSGFTYAQIEAQFDRLRAENTRLRIDITHWKGVAAYADSFSIKGHVDELAQIRASLSTAVDRLDDMAKQMTSEEIEANHAGVLDFEYGYDVCVGTARKILAQLRPLLAGKQPAVAPSDLRSCTICGLTVDLSKGHVPPTIDFSMQGRSKKGIRDDTEDSNKAGGVFNPEGSRAGPQPPAAEVKAECPTCKGCAVVWCGAADTGMPVGCPDCTSTRAVKVEEKLS